MIDLLIRIELLTYQVKKYTKKNERLIYHLPRCNSMGASIKLTVMILANSTYIASLMQELTQSLKILKTQLVPKVRNYDYQKTPPICLPPPHA